MFKKNVLDDIIFEKKSTCIISPTALSKTEKPNLPLLIIDSPFNLGSAIFITIIGYKL